MVVFSKMPPIRRHWFIGLSLLAVALIFAIGALLWQVVELSSLSAVSEQVARLKSFADVTRLLLITMLTALWPRLVDLAARYGQVDTIDRSQLHALRWRVVAWLLIIELMIGQDLIGLFFLATSGPIT